MNLQLLTGVIVLRPVAVVVLLLSLGGIHLLTLLENYKEKKNKLGEKEEGDKDE